MADETERKWFFEARNGNQIGPCGWLSLKSFSDRGELLPTTLVWTGGQADWLPATETALRTLFDGVALPPPLPRERTQPSGEEDDAIEVWHQGTPRLTPPASSLNTDRDLMMGYTGSYGDKAVSPALNADVGAGRNGGSRFPMIAFIFSVPVLWALATVAYLNPKLFPNGHARELAPWAVLIAYSTLVPLVMWFTRRAKRSNLKAKSSAGSIGRGPGRTLVAGGAIVAVAAVAIVVWPELNPLQFFTGISAPQTVEGRREAVGQFFAASSCSEVGRKFSESVDQRFYSKDYLDDGHRALPSCVAYLRSNASRLSSFGPDCPAAVLNAADYYRDLGEQAAEIFSIRVKSGGTGSIDLEARAINRLAKQTWSYVDSACIDLR